MPVNVGSNPNDGSGDPLRTAFIALNNDIAEALAALAIVRSGRIQHTTNPNIAALTLTDGVEQIQVATNTGVYIWRRLAGAPASPNPAIHAQSLDGRWWQLAEDTLAIKTSVAAAVNQLATAAFPPFTINSADSTANTIVGTVPYGNGTSFGANQRISLTPLLANTGPATVNNVQIRNADGVRLSGGELAPGRMIFLERDATTNFFRMIGGGASLSDLQSLLTPLAARMTIVEAATTAPFQTIVGEDVRAIITDSTDKAIMSWVAGEAGGFDMILAERMMDRIGAYLNLGGGVDPGDGGLLSSTSVQAIGVNGQSLSVGGDFNPNGFPPSIVQRNELIARARDGAGLLLAGTVRGDDFAIVVPDQPRSQGYNEGVPATGFAPLLPSVTGVTAAFPLAVALNEYRLELGIPMVPIVSQCHGVSGQLIENIDNDPNTGTAGYLTIWNNLRYWHQQVRAVALAEGKTVSVPWHYWVHGTSAAGYAEGEYLRQFWKYKDDMQELMRTIGLEGGARMLVSQAGGNTRIDSPGNQWHVVDEQLQFCEQGGGVLTTPEYAYEIFDNNVHPDAHALTQIAEVAARAAAEIEAGKRWTIHRPKFSVIGNVVVLDFDMLRPGEYLVSHNPDRYAGQGIDQYLGFEAVGTTITGIAIRGQTVALTCAAPPTGVRYAYQRQDVRGFANNRYNAHRGLLRTDEQWRSKLLNNVMLYRWIPSFKMTF